MISGGVEAIPFMVELYKEIILQKATIKDIPELLAIEEKLTNLKTYSAMTTAKEWQDEFDNKNVTICYEEVR